MVEHQEIKPFALCDFFPRWKLCLNKGCYFDPAEVQQAITKALKDVK